MSVTVGSAGYSSQQPSQYEPSLAISNPATRVWLTTGNTDVVTDASCHPSSCLVTTPQNNTPAGFWKVVASQGSFTVTSSDSESAGLTYNYTLL
jgi:hypothetical protein